MKYDDDMKEGFYDNSEPTEVNLWFVRETEKARLYSRIPFEREPGPSDHIWVPKSLVEHTTKFPNGLHVVRLPLWFAERESL